MGPPVVPIHVEPWPKGASNEWQSKNYVKFLDDDSTDDEDAQNIGSNSIKERITTSSSNTNGYDSDEVTSVVGIIGGARIPTKSLFAHVAVGGTFDGMHYGK